MNTLTKLTLATVTAMTLGTATLLAGPGPIGPVPTQPARPHPQATRLMKCERMVENKAPRLGGTAVVPCTKAVKDTLACRLACR